MFTLFPLAPQQRVVNGSTTTSRQLTRSGIVSQLLDATRTVQRVSINLRNLVSLCLNGTRGEHRKHNVSNQASGNFPCLKITRPPSSLGPNTGTID